jgi:beta-lactamase superfamily II metal-dependent hydrolase
MQQALSARGVRRFWEPAFEHPSPPLDSLAAWLEEKHIPAEQVAAGRSLDLGGGARLEVLSPPAPPLKGGRSEADANAVVLRITYGQRKLLLASDAEPETEAALLARGQAGAAS